MCAAISGDVAEQEDVCGFVIVSAFQTYNDYYKGLEEELGQWKIDVMESDLNDLEESGVSPTASTSTETMVDETYIEPAVEEEVVEEAAPEEATPVEETPAETEVVETAPEETAAVQTGSQSELE